MRPSQKEAVTSLTRVVVGKRRNGARKPARNHSNENALDCTLLGRFADERRHLAPGSPRHDRRRPGSFDAPLAHARGIPSTGNVWRSWLNRSIQSCEDRESGYRVRRKLPTGWNRRGGAWEATEGVRGWFGFGQGSSSTFRSQKDGASAGGPRIRDAANGRQKRTRKGTVRPPPAPCMARWNHGSELSQQCDRKEPPSLESSEAGASE